MAKEHIYKLYNPDGSYIRTLPADEVMSEYEPTEEINTVGTDIDVELDRPATNFGEGVDINFRNIVKIYCKDKEQPNGLLVFQGRIINYTPMYNPERLVLNVKSLGQETDKYILSEDEVADVSQATGAAEQTFNYERPVAQSFIATANPITSVDIKLKTTGAIGVEVLLVANQASSNTPDLSNILGQISKSISDTTQTVHRFTFPAAIVMNEGVKYWIVVRAASAGTVYEVIPTNQGNHYSQGSAYSTSRDGTGFLSAGTTGGGVGQWTGGGSYTYTYNWLKFSTVASVIPTNALLSSAILRMKDQGTGSIRNVSFIVEALARTWTHPMTTGQFVAGGSLGGLSKLAEATIDTTPSVRNYDFTSNANALRDAIQTARAGSNVDILLATNRQRAGNAPTGSEEVQFYAIASVGDEPRLRVTASPETLTVQYATGSPYANGDMMTREADGTWSTVSGGDLYFVANTSVGATKITYTLTDTGQMVRNMMASYNNKGGEMAYSTSTVALTGQVLTYEFNANTYNEAIKKARDMSPVGYYYRADLGEGNLYFDKHIGTIDHHFTIKKDILNLKIEKRVEDVVNVVYFIGGETGGGFNYYKKFVNEASVAKYGFRAITYSDQNVTLDATATAIANTILQSKGEPEIRLVVEVADSNFYAKGYDTETLKLGQMASFRGFGERSSLWDVMQWDVDFWDYSLRNVETLVLQIVRLERKKDRVVMAVSTSANDLVNKKLDAIARELKTTIATNNPTTPE